MFVLQRVQNAQVTFSAHTYKSDLLEDVRSNYGLTEAEFWEFIANNGSIERPEIYLGSFEGEIPDPEASFSKAAKQAQAAQRARKATR